MNTVSEKAKRGRPRSISVDAILDMSIQLLQSAPGQPLSLNATARALGVTPMALYTYFENKDALQQAVTEKLLNDVFDFNPEAKCPYERIEVWANAVREQFLKKPELISLLSTDMGHSTLYWFERSHVIARSLRECGVEDDKLAFATYWIWKTVLTTIHAETLEKIKRTDIESDEGFSPACQLASSARQPDFYARLFTFQISKMLDSFKPD